MMLPEGPFEEVWEAVKYSAPPAEASISRASANRRINRRESVAHMSEKREMVGMWGARVGVMGCWGEPLRNSPKFMALECVNTN